MIWKKCSLASRWHFDKYLQQYSATGSGATSQTQGQRLEITHSLKHCVELMGQACSPIRYLNHIKKNFIAQKNVSATTNIVFF